MTLFINLSDIRQLWNLCLISTSSVIAIHQFSISLEIQIDLPPLQVSKA